MLSKTKNALLFKTSLIFTNTLKKIDFLFIFLDFASPAWASIHLPAAQEVYFWQWLESWPVPGWNFGAGVCVSPSNNQSGCLAMKGFRSFIFLSLPMALWFQHQFIGAAINPVFLLKDTLSLWLMSPLSQKVQNIPLQWNIICMSVNQWIN